MDTRTDTHTEPRKILHEEDADSFDHPPMETIIKLPEESDSSSESDDEAPKSPHHHTQLELMQEASVL